MTEQIENMEYISSYSRAQAIDDGVLIDVSETAREAGFVFPVAVTQGVWQTWIDPHGLEFQDEQGRLWDILTMLRFTIKRSIPGLDTISFTVRMVVAPKRPPELVPLWSKCGPGDNREPVLTIMLEDEN